MPGQVGKNAIHQFKSALASPVKVFKDCTIFIFSKDSSLAVVKV